MFILKLSGIKNKPFIISIIFDICLYFNENFSIYIFDSDLVWRMQLINIKG